MLNIAHACISEEVNGPGRRFTVWVQGCRRGCPGCFNPGLQSFRPRRALRPQELADEAQAEAPFEGVTFSGGEPFEQASELAAFLDLVRAGPERAGLTAVSFTGYLLEELRAGPAPWRELLARLDLLVDGPFRADESCDLPLRGSGNQRLVALTAAGETLLRRLEAGGRQGFEVTIAPGGDVILAGFPPPDVRLRLERLLRGEGGGEEGDGPDSRGRGAA